MPGRRDKFTNNGIYHVFNRTIDRKRLFSSPALSEGYLRTLFYYRSRLIDRCYSHFKLLDVAIQEKRKQQLSSRKYFKVDILGYCLMPTHFHLLIQQLSDNGMISFMSNVMNSFTRVYNVKNKRRGPLFLPRFQSREILSDEQFVHVSRYIHLNPYSSALVQTIKGLTKYPWSSYKFYVDNSIYTLVNTKRILQLFRNEKSLYKKFVEDQADYQRSLENLKYIEKWE